MRARRPFPTSRLTRTVAATVALAALGAGPGLGSAFAADDFTVNSVTVCEFDSGTNNANFTITRGNPSAGAASVDFSTTNATATAGEDYTSTTGTDLPFAAGVTARRSASP